MIKLKDLLTEGNKFDDVYKDYGFDLEKKSGGLTYWAHYGSDISGHKNSYIRGELSGWTDGKKAAVGDDRGRQSFSNPKKMAKWFEKNFKMKKESVNEGPWPVKGKLGGVSQEAKLLEKAFKAAGVKVFKVKEYGSRGANYFVDVQAKGGKTTISIEVNQVSNVVFMHQPRGRTLKLGELRENPRELIKVLKMLKNQPGFGQGALVKKESVNEAFAIQYKKDKRYLTSKELFDKKPQKFDTEKDAKNMLKGLDYQYRGNYKIVKIKESVNEMPNFDRGTSGLPRGWIEDYNKIVKKLSKGKGYGTLSRSDKQKVWATLGKKYNESVNESSYHQKQIIDFIKNSSINISST